MDEKRLSEIQSRVQEAYERALRAIVTKSGVALWDVLHLSGPGTASRRDEYFHESFSGEMLSCAEYNFCKTARKKYDLAVKMALIEAQRLSDNAWDITCDEGGKYDKDTILIQGDWETWLPIENLRGEMCV
jgi:hypothetical protein